MDNLNGDEQLRLYEQIVANMANGVNIIKVIDNTIVYANFKLEKLFGYNHKELEGIHVSKLNAATDRSSQQITDEINQELTDNGEWHGKIKNIKKDGTLFWSHVDLSTFNHSVYGNVFIAIHFDITEQILSSKKLKESQILLKSSIESTKELLFISIDKEYRYLFFNTAYKDVMKSYYGVDVEIGMRVLDCITKNEDRELAKRHYDNSFDGVAHTQIDEYDDGYEVRHYETYYNPIYNNDNEIIGATAFAKEITARKRFEGALIESEERFKMLSELSSEGIIIHDDGIGIDINKGFEDIVGYNKEEVIGRNIIDLLIPEEYQEMVYQNLNDDRFERYEVVVRRKDGVLLNIQIGGRRQIIYNGKKVLVTTAKDISEDRKNILRTKRSEADLVSQIENTTESIWSVDKNYRITVINSILMRDFNIAFNHQLKIGDRVIDYVPNSLKSIWKERYDRALNGERFTIIDTYDYEGLPQFVETAFNPVIVDGKVEGAACFNTDMTRQKNTEKALIVSEKKFKRLSDFSPASISMQTTDKYLYVNKSWELLTGYSNEEILTVSPMEIIHPDFVEEIKRRSDARLRGERVPERYDLKILTKSNEVKWVDISFSVIEYENKTASLGVCFDITELKKAKEALLVSESKLQVANATKNKFFSIIAHDLRSPFSSIIGFSNILNTEYDRLTDDERKVYINELSSTSNRTFVLLEKLLNWARAQQGGIVINKVPLNLKSLIIKAIDPYMTNADQKNIKVDYSISEDISILADEYTLITVIGNLFNNAVKYSYFEGCITLKAQTTATEISVYVSDVGVGMTPSIISKLFRLVENNSTRGTNNERGTGLGLTICKEFVELNGGSLSVESKEGAGSTFSFHLPR